MKKRVLSMFMALALCLTLLPAPVRAAEDTPESGAIVQQERQEEFRPPYPNRLERMRKRTVQRVTRKIPVPLTPVALRTVKQMRRRAARMKRREQCGRGGIRCADDDRCAAIVSELDGMTADELDAAYDDIQAAYDAYEALNAEQQAQITGADFEALLGWFNSQTALLADAQSGEHTHCVCGKDSGTTVIP